VEYDELSKIGLDEMIRFVTVAEQMHKRSLKIIGAIGTKVKETTKIARQMAADINTLAANSQRAMRDIPGHDKFLFDRVHHHVAFTECVHEHCSIIQYRPSSEGATDIRRLAERINSRVNPFNNNA
jgi:cellulose biosynthesis protein BcsQ